MKTERLQVRVTPDLLHKFEEACVEKHEQVSVVIRRLMLQYIEETEKEGDVKQI